jgi:hypothetical protein
MSSGKLVGWYKAVTGGVLTVGLVLDVASLLWSMEEIGRVAFTPLGEIILSLWFFAAFVLGVTTYSAMDLRSVPAKVFQAIIVFYMLALTLMHGVNNLILNNLGWYLKTFSGPVYPYVAGAVLLTMLVFTLTRRAQSDAPSGVGA